jgi:nucleotide-binding universal stress UspA family protein
MLRSARVIVGIDGSPASDLALRWAIEHARASGATLRLVCAYPWTLIEPGDLPLEDPETPEPDHLRIEAQRLLATARERAAVLAPDLAIRSGTIEGNPVQALLSESSRASVLVLGSRGRKALGSVLLGSVGGAVTARSRCPVVVLRAPANDRAAVIVGFDGTHPSEAALAFAYDYASKHRLPLMAVFCWAGHRLPGRSRLDPPPALEHAESWLAEVLAGWQDKHPDVTVRREVIQDDPARALVQASLHQSLLVVGNGAKHGVTGTMLGSVSQAVLHHAICPVAVVPTPTS